MMRREFVQRFLLARMSRIEKILDEQGTVNINAKKIIQGANQCYDQIEADEKIAADNSMPDTRDYLNSVAEKH